MEFMLTTKVSRSLSKRLKTSEKKLKSSRSPSGRRNTITPGRKLLKLNRLIDSESLSTISENLHNGSLLKKNSKNLIKLSIRTLRSLMSQKIGKIRWKCLRLKSMRKELRLLRMSLKISRKP